MATKKALKKKLASTKKNTKVTTKKTVKQAVAKKSAKKAVKLQKKVVAKVAKKAVAKKVVAKKAPAQKAVAKVTLQKPIAQKAPVNVVAKPVVAVAKPAIALVEKKVAAKPVKQPESKGFAVGDYVVYPTHGVGRITGIEVETIGEYELKVFVIAFEKDKMTLRVPVGRAAAAGLRGISGSDDITRALTTLKGRAKIARRMWSRRAQEYEAKINSGNIVQIAEVVRDLHKNVDQSERSYSERMIYETAMHRLMGEIAAFDKVDMPTAHDKLIKVLKKQAA